MFDPSKLDLELDKNEKANEEVKIDDTQNLETNDVLENLTVPKAEKKQEILQEKDSTPEEDKVEEITEKIINEEDIWKTEYEKSIIKPVKEEKIEENTEKKIIFDVNLTSVDILLAILVDKEYDFATFEPSEEAVKITFRKDKVVKDVKYIKYPIYSDILIKAKILTKLTVEETENQQEWEWKTKIRNKNYKITTKVVPSPLWAKLFIKAVETKEKIAKKAAKKVWLSTIFTFLWIVSLITLIVWGSFLSFIVLNAKTVEDVSFFASLWINLNDINVFLWQTVAFIFSVLIFLETVFLVVYLFKLFLTKKEFKQKKIRYWIIATVILIFTFATASAWMIIDKKIKALPNWQEMSYWDVQVYDNSKLISESFDKQWSLIDNTDNLIWPVEIKFDLSFYAQNEERKWLKIKKYIWDFWDDNIVETPLSTIVHKFNNKWNHEVTLNIEQTDIQWNIIEKEVDWIPSINISHIVKINEKMLNNWWKMVEFDATWLKELWKIEWYFMDDLNTPKYIWDYFRHWTPIFEETLIWMYIRRNDKVSEALDKLFIINWEDETSLNWKIQFERSLINDFEYELWVDDLQNEFWKWYIEEYKWIIWDKEITNIWDISDPVKSSKINFEFEWSWEFNIKVILKDSSGETKEIETVLNIEKVLKLSKPLRIFNWETLLENVDYEEKLNDYYINQIWVPTKIKLDTRFIRSNNINYTLKKVDWDYNSDWDIDESSKIWNYEINSEWNHTITVHYEFVNRKIPDDIIKMKEQIFIEWLKKEAIIDFKIIKNSSYVPITVSFDASKSQVKNENIEKFIWDYGDGFTEEKDAIVKWHKYTTPWNYDIILTVVTSSWKEYSTTKKLILKPKPQSVKISTSMKKAPTMQWIDFSSDDSEWQIIAYFWNFWDGNTSIEANPTHFYKKAWEYKVVLKVDYSNKNVLEDSLNIEIY